MRGGESPSALGPKLAGRAKAQARWPAEHSRPRLGADARRWWPLRGIEAAVAACLSEASRRPSPVAPQRLLAHSKALERYSRVGRDPGKMYWPAQQLERKRRQSRNSVCSCSPAHAGERWCKYAPHWSESVSSTAPEQGEDPPAEAVVASEKPRPRLPERSPSPSQPSSSAPSGNAACRSNF